MDLASFFLICFFIGLGLTLASMLMGSLHLGGDAGSGHSGGHGADAGADAGGDFGAATASHGKVSHLSPFNFWVLVGFLTWFGAGGYALSRVPLVGGVLAVVMAVPVGAVGGYIIYWFVDRILVRLGTSGIIKDGLAPGVVGQLTVPIRAGGTGEMVYSHSGTRKVIAARSVNGNEIPRGTEVVVARYEKGVAYVQSWADYTAHGGSQSGLGRGAE